MLNLLYHTIGIYLSGFYQNSICTNLAQLYTKIAQRYYPGTKNKKLDFYFSKFFNLL